MHVSMNENECIGEVMKLLTLLHARKYKQSLYDSVAHMCIHNEVNELRDSAKRE